MKKENELTIRIDTPLTREVSSKDKFFIVFLSLDGKDNSTVGWIEKEFNEKEFIEKYLESISHIHIPEKVEVLNVLDFDNRDDFEKAKEANGI